MKQESREIIQELNRALEALRRVDPRLSRAEAIQESVVIEDLWEELLDVDQVTAHSWAAYDDVDLTREVIYQGSSLPFTLDNLGEIPGGVWGEEADHTDYSPIEGDFEIGPDAWADPDSWYEEDRNE